MNWIGSAQSDDAHLLPGYRSLPYECLILQNWLCFAKFDKELQVAVNMTSSGPTVRIQAGSSRRQISAMALGRSLFVSFAERHASNSSDSREGDERARSIS